MKNEDVVHDNRVAALTGIPLTASSPSAPVLTETPVTTGSNAPAPIPVRNYVVLSNIQWYGPYIDSDNITAKNTTTGKYSVKREFIDGQEKEVLTLDANLGKGGNHCLVQFGFSKDTLLEEVRQGSGVRFKALGDGKPWIFALHMPIVGKNNFYYEISFDRKISTKKGKVVEVNIPYSKLRKASYYEESIKFDKSSVVQLEIRKHSQNVGGAGGRGESTIKIFDFEIY